MAYENIKILQIVNIKQLFLTFISLITLTCDFPALSKSSVISYMKTIFVDVWNWFDTCYKMNDSSDLIKLDGSKNT